jgi:hypothetical protein
MRTGTGKEPPASPEVAVRRINERWIVRGNLRESARDYLDHLASVDPARLERSCGIALALTRTRERLEDPKPLFYAGLFCLASRSEAEVYLTAHRLTLMVWRKLRDELPDDSGNAAHFLADDIAQRVSAEMRKLL